MEEGKEGGKKASVNSFGYGNAHMNRLFFNISEFARLSWIKSSGEEERARHGATGGSLLFRSS